MIRLALCLLIAFLAGVRPALTEPTHGIAMHGALKYPKDFNHFDYADPAAVPGGTLRLAVNGSFDSLNPLIVTGLPAASIQTFVYETLLARSLDEPFSLYGLLAESVEMAPDRSSVTFTLNPKAQFSDNKPVTVDDVIFSFELLRERGRPNHRQYYKKVTEAVRTGDHGITFRFAPGDREMPLIIGLMPVLPRHAIDPDLFEKPSLSIPVGSGPYVISAVDPGRMLTFTRNPGYWGKDLPVNRGRFNFEKVEYSYFRDQSALFESFKTGAIHLQGEGEPSQWVSAYDFPAVAEGKVVKAELPIGVPAGMSGLVFNTRKPLFADQRVRAALGLLFDFEWVNKSLYSGLYSRTGSYFERSELSSLGTPASASERALLAPFPAAVKPEVLEGTWHPPVSDGQGYNRTNLRKALRLLKEAGYSVKDGVLRREADGAPFSFEIMTTTRSQERLLGSYVAGLAQAGITAQIRQVDSALYQDRLDRFDFDMVQYFWPASLSPGNEQLFRWSSVQAATKGSYNLAGVESPAVDAMIAAMLAATKREDFVAAVHALDRVLISGDYVVPLFHLKQQWVAHWHWLRYPKVTPLYGYQLDTWWADPATRPSH